MLQYVQVITFTILKKKNYFFNFFSSLFFFLIKMDAVSAHLSANAGRVKPNDLVLDPYCGTGSLLIGYTNTLFPICIDYLTK